MNPFFLDRLLVHLKHLFCSFGVMRDTETELQLPPPKIRRWTIRRKAAVLQALTSGALTREEASRCYALSLDELQAWERDFERHGLHGLRATRVQIYRVVRRGNPRRE